MTDDPPDSLEAATRALSQKSDQHYEEVMDNLDKRFGKREMSIYSSNRLGNGKGPRSEG